MTPEPLIQLTDNSPFLGGFFIITKSLLLLTGIQPSLTVALAAWTSLSQDSLPSFVYREVSGEVGGDGV